MLREAGDFNIWLGHTWVSGHIGTWGKFDGIVLETPQLADPAKVISNKQEDSELTTY